MVLSAATLRAVDAKRGGSKDLNGPLMREDSHASSAMKVFAALDDDTMRRSPNIYDRELRASY